MKFRLPGPGAYEAKNYIQVDPSFPAGYFQKTVRPLNKLNIISQIERVEEVADSNFKQKIAE